MQPLPASYYGSLDKSNPVILAFEKDLKEFRSYVKRIRDSLSFDHCSYLKGSLKLFDIWKKYEPRLPSLYYEETLLDISDFLFENNFYRLALWQGYKLYLQRISPASLESIRDVKQFEQVFFPQGFHTAGAKLTLRALYGECVCVFHLERERCKQPDCIGMQKLLSILGFLRIIMQAILPHEILCWLLYNGSLYIYNICRFLMSVSHSAQAIEYLLWACVCLEKSIPLLTPRFLPWRATLYCSVCECYYSGEAAVQAEVFARQALAKIDELGKLQKMTGLPSTPETNQAFKDATIKVASMVFKRLVYESQRKPKGFFRLKQKGNLKDVQNPQSPWPRTTTERILMELFEGNAAQFLAVLEALWDSSRRPLQTGTLADTDDQEVAIELMSAGISILSGIGGSPDRVRNDSLPLSLNALAPTCTLLEMAIAGENQISVDAAVKFAKLLFRYEQWDVFCSLSDNLVTMLSSLEGRLFRKAELELTLLEAMERVLSTQRVRQGTKDLTTDIQSDKEQPSGLISMTDELLNLVQTLHVCVCEAAQDIRPDEDLVLDIVLFLWAKYKLVFQRVQARPDPACYIGKMALPDKWVQTLFLLCEVAYMCHLAEIDPVAVAEMTLRLTSVLEINADSLPLTIPAKDSNKDSKLQTPSFEKPTATPSLNLVAEHLEMAWTVLKKGLECVSRSRTVSLSHDASAISDTVFLQKFSGESLRSSEHDEQIKNGSSMRSLLIDMHMELLAFQHRIFFKLLDIYPDDENPEGKKKPLVQNAERQFTTEYSERARAEDALQDKIEKNKISKVLFLAQKALFLYKKDATNKCTKKLLEEALTLLEKAGLEEKRMTISATSAEMGSGVEEGCRPPPPVLLSRSNQSLTFTPATYMLEEQVCWYGIYGKEVERVNLKVRTRDCHLVGTGEMISSRSERLFHVSGLEPNQKYVFAVAAYDAQGNLIGSRIGDTTRPVLASLPLPLLTTWGHLAQVAYQTGQYTLAKKTCSEIWSHFTLPAVTDSGVCEEPVDKKATERLAQTKLCPEILQLSSPVLQQLFLTSIFIQTNIHIQEGALYCDSLSDGSPLIWGQEARLAECENMLVALDLSLHLNDSNAALQAVVTCYGLLAPLVFYQIPSDPAIQVLLKCLKVLQKISAALKQKRPVATSESLYHMVACITQYVGKGLKDEFLASSVMEQGKQLLLEMNENLQPQDRVKKPQKKAEACSQEAEPSEELKALTCIALKQHEKLQTFETRDDPAWNREAADYFDSELSGEENPNILYKIIGSSSVRNDFQNVMKFKEMSCFMEFAALLLQKALQKDELELLIQWGQEIFNWLKSRDENFTLPKKPNRNLRNDQKKFTSSIIQYCIKINRAYKKKNVLKKSVSSSKGSEKEFKAVETLMKQLGLLRRHQQQKMMRQVLSYELPWRCLANLTLAQAHLGLLRRNFQLHPVAPAQQCYSKLSLHFFSLAHTGTLVKWSNISQHIKPPELSPLFLKPTIHKAKGIGQGAANINGETSGESEVETDQEILTSDSDCSETTSRNRFKPLDTIYKASVYLRRAMVLAYRGSLWTSLQWVCENLWDQFNSIAFIIECNQSSETYSTLTLDQFYTVFTPLLALASDLLIDMIEKLQLWKVYDEEGEELEARPLNAGMLVDLKWMKILVLHTLELLFYQAKWETLVHLALIYNFFTRERYTHIITPVLVYAQRRLLERISSFGGPSVPQPHFTYTESVTGEKVTCRNYAEKQLLLHSSVESWLDNSATKVSSEPLELEERKRAMCVVSVPLDIDDTLHCFRESLSKRCHTVCSFQHSHTLLMLLLAEAQHSIEAPFCEESFHGSQASVEFTSAASIAPSISPPDLSNEDYNSMGSVYSSPLSPSHIKTVLSSYNSSIKYLQENNYNSLQVQALHDLGNLHFYNGNLKAAHSNWSKALDHALQTTNVLESWDGDSSSQPLRHAGIWGCLQGALLSAKIAQYILTSNISQRTNCCLLSAKLFKCLLKASMPHPGNDLEYSSYTLNKELIPGMNVFSEVDQTFAGSTVASLDFVCHWLYTSGHHLTALPLVVLYQYVASTVCRHPQLTAASRILKVKMLTELHLFAEAVKEIHNLCDGEEVPLPYSSYVKAEKVSKWKKFSHYKPLTDPCNLEVLEELVNKKITEDIMAIYSTKLTCRLHIARLQLILAMCRTMHDLPEPFTEDLEALMRSTSPCWRNSDEFSSNTSLINVEPKGLQLQSQKDALTPGQIKALLLKEIFEQLSSELFAFQHTHTDPEELELAVEIKLLLSSLTLQQGKAASSADQAASALRLLQDSPLLQNDSIKQPLLKHPSSVLKHSRIKTEQLGEAELDAGPQLGDVPAAVEALERMGRSLWLRCTLALVQSLTAHIPGTVIYPGVDSSVEADGLIRQGLADAEAWGDPDTQTMLLLQRVTLNTHCGRALEESTSMLQEVVSLLSGCSALSLHSGLLLAKATLLLGELRGSDGQSLYILAQKLLQQQLKTLGEGTVQKAGGESIPAWRNIYHPQLSLLSRTTMHLGKCLALQAVLSSKKDDEQHSNLWLLAQEELHTALIISRASATRDPQLEANILYLKGSVERVLMSLGTLSHQTVVKTFLESITRAHSHSHSLQLIHACYMELSLIYLQNMENSNNDLAEPPRRLKPNKCSNSTPVAESNLLLLWVCLRAAGRTMEVFINHARLCGITADTEGPIPLISLQALAYFASNDLLIPCGGLEEPMLDQLSSAPDTESSPKVKRSSEITWVHLSRYYTHLLNLRHISTQPMAGQSVNEVISLASDSNLTLRLNQLHTFFCDHLTIYKKMCVIPDPPSALILEPQTIQQSVSRLYPWAALNKHQLCIQWHRHMLASSGLSDKMITLVFALNKDQMSNSKTNIQAAADIKAGHRLISLDSLKALHVQLISVCVEAEVDLRVPAFSSSSKNTSVRCLQKSEPDSRTPVKVSNSTLQQILLEKTSHICTEIRNLLKPDLKEIPITKVPFKPSVQILCDLERCFNPASGATLEDKALSDWLFSLLT